MSALSFAPAGAVIELPATGVSYFEPRDVTLQELLAKLNRPGLKSIPGAHDRGTRLRVLWPDQEMELVHITALPHRLMEVLSRKPMPSPTILPAAAEQASP